MADDTQIQKPATPLTDRELLRAIGKPRGGSIDKILNLLQISILETEDNAGSQLGATTETAEST